MSSLVRERRRERISESERTVKGMMVAPGDCPLGGHKSLCWQITQIVLSREAEGTETEC